MKFEKGQPRLPNAGRKPGSSNKVTVEIRARLQLLIDRNFDEFQIRMANLPDDQFCEMYIKILPYITPKQKEIQATVTGGGGFALILPDNQRDTE